MPRRSLSRSLLALGIFAGLSLGLACDKGGSNSPGGSSVEGSGSCPGSLPRNGASCPRGETDFCVYRSSAGDHVCSCGKGNWRCAKK
jgi:hypothetical protein